MRRLLLSFLVCSPLLVGPPSAAGERLSLEDLTARADAVAVVRVRFGAEGDAAEAVEWLQRGEARAAPSSAWWGLCLPGRELLEKWIAGHPHFPSRDLWRRAVEAGGYEAVVFFRVRDGVLVPTCETESMLAEGWTTHPGHAAWKARLEALLAGNQAPAPPAPLVPTPTSAPAEERAPARGCS